MPDEIIVQGNPDIHNIALTFDDGPGRITPYILDVLRKYGVKATFFCLGCCIEKNIIVQEYTGKDLTGSEIVKRANDEGHLIAIHSYNHRALPGLTEEEILDNELSRTKNIITNLTGKAPVYFRPPYGSIDDRVNKISKVLGLKTVLWSCRSADSSTETAIVPDGSLRYKYGPVDIYKNIMETTGNGSIILCHDGHSGKRDANLGIVSALDKAIPELQKKGFNFVTIDELLAAGNYTIHKSI
ncbi:polysaccharide deacetylase family protein [Methanosarcina hadiensis]|uniref:polysaccharide deacetylase family protein n=1 Tax=Methanosarcina hadiensis TaxID=3078083 RepID=UPI00397766B3